MFQLNAEQVGKMGVELRIYCDGKCVARRLLPLSETVRLVGLQDFSVEFETMPGPLPAEMRIEEIGTLSPKELSVWRGEGG